MGTVQMSHSTRNFIITITVAAMFLIAFFISTGAISPRGNHNPTVDSLSTTFGGTVFYSDGTQYSFHFPSSQALSVLPLTIIDPSQGNKIVSTIEFDMHVTAVFTGTASSWTLSGSSFNTICHGVKQTSTLPDTIHPIYTSPSTPFSQHGGALSSGSDIVASQFITSTNTLQSLYSGWQTSTSYFWFLAFSGSVSMTIIFSDGTSGTLSQEANTINTPAWMFNYQGTNVFSSLSVTLNPPISS